MSDSPWDTGEILLVTIGTLRKCVDACNDTPDQGLVWRNLGWVARSMLRLLDGHPIQWRGSTWRLVEVSDEGR